MPNIDIRWIYSVCKTIIRHFKHYLQNVKTLHIILHYYDLSFLNFSVFLLSKQNDAKSHIFYWRTHLSHCLNAFLIYLLVYIFLVVRRIKRFLMYIFRKVETELSTMYAPFGEKDLRFSYTSGFLLQFNSYAQH